MTWGSDALLPSRYSAYAWRTLASERAQQLGAPCAGPPARRTARPGTRAVPRSRSARPSRGRCPPAWPRPRRAPRRGRLSAPRSSRSRCTARARRDDEVGLDALSAGERHAARPPTLHVDALDPRLGPHQCRRPTRGDGRARRSAFRAAARCLAPVRCTDRVPAHERRRGPARRGQGRTARRAREGRPHLGGAEPPRDDVPVALGYLLEPGAHRLPGPGTRMKRVPAPSASAAPGTA